jgi:hypothetical protein
MSKPLYDRTVPPGKVLIVERDGKVEYLPTGTEVTADEMIGSEDINLRDAHETVKLPDGKIVRIRTSTGVEYVGMKGEASFSDLASGELVDAADMSYNFRPLETNKPANN